MLKLIAVLALTVLTTVGLWLYGKLLAYASTKANRRSTDAEHEMQVRYQPPPNHRRGDSQTPTDE